MPAPNRPSLTLDDPLAGRAPEPSAAPNPYEGAPSRQFNTRLLVPLHERYARLVRALKDEGFETTTTEVVHALLDEGPRGTDQARALVRRWRATRNAAGGGP